MAISSGLGPASVHESLKLAIKMHASLGIHTYRLHVGFQGRCLLLRLCATYEESVQCGDRSGGNDYPKALVCIPEAGAGAGAGAG